MPYVQPAREEREQNLEAFLKNGQLHYRAIRTVLVNEELLVWYSKEFALLLGVPELQTFHIKGNIFFINIYNISNTIFLFLFTFILNYF